jgi:hypothetical protein
MHHNKAVGGAGLALHTEQRVTVESCSFRKNSAKIAAGLISNARELVLKDVVFEDNEVEGAGATHASFGPVTTSSTLHLERVQFGPARTKKADLLKASDGRTVLTVNAVDTKWPTD